MPAFALLWLTAESRACDAALLAQTKTNLETSKASGDVKYRKLVGSLAESCKFAPALGSTLTTLTGADIPMRPKLEQKIVLTDPLIWDSACAGGKAAFDAAFAATGAAREQALYGPCDVARYKFAAPGELSRATGTVFVALMVAKHFEETGVPDNVAIPLERAVAGLGPPTASATAAPPPQDPWAVARGLVDGLVGKAYDALPPEQWSAAAGQLLPLCEQLRARPVPERQQNRKLEFETCAEAGRAAENLGQQAAPFFRPLGAATLNWGYYLAGATAKADPTLVGFARDEEIKGAVGWYVQQLQSGALPMPQ